jgi:hypothetical protein
MEKRRLGDAFPPSVRQQKLPATSSMMALMGGVARNCLNHHGFTPIAFICVAG